jgi:hypothetical protein
LQLLAGVVTAKRRNDCDHTGELACLSIPERTVPNLLSFDVRSSSNVVVGGIGIEERSMDAMVITTISMRKRVIVQ